MYERSELSYSKGGLTVGIGLGLLSGVASTIWYHHKKVLSAGQVPENIKSSLLKEGAIGGSWISLEEEPTKKFAIRSSTCRGSLSRMEDGEIVYYGFLVDTHTGTILEISRKKGATDQHIKKVRKRTRTHYSKEKHHVLFLQWVASQTELSRHIFQYFLPK